MKRMKIKRNTKSGLALERLSKACRSLPKRTALISRGKQKTLALVDRALSLATKLLKKGRWEW